MTRKEFVLNVTEELMKNPRAILAGHGISAAVLQTLIQRPDAMSKLGVTLWSTKYAKKGAKGLKKAPNFVIKGYKNFGEFNMKAREDVETFIAGLSDKDAATFNNAEGILTIVMTPDEKVKNAENIEETIITGKSYVKDFDSAVRKEFRTPMAMYIIVMIGKSAARPAEVNIAKRKEKINKKKNSRRTPAKIKAEMKAKAAKKIAINKRKIASLKEESFRTSKELQQYAQIGKEFGALSSAPTHIIGAINKYGVASAQAKAAVKAAEATLTSDQRKVYNIAKKYLKAGDKKAARAMLKALGNSDLSNYLLEFGGKIQSSDSVLAGRKKAIKNQITKLTTRSEQLLVDLALAPENKKASIRSMISKNSSKIKELRARLGTYRNISVAGMKKKSAMLAKANADIEKAIAKGASIQQALNSSIAKLDAKTTEKQIIKEQVIQQVANGTPMQYAVQQAIQQTITGVDAVDPTNLLTGNSTVEDILNSLG